MFIQVYEQEWMMIPGPDLVLLGVVAFISRRQYFLYTITVLIILKVNYKRVNVVV